MALIKSGSIHDFSVKIETEKVGYIGAGGENMSSFREVIAARRTEEDIFKYEVSKEPRGLALKKLRLAEGFEGFLGNMFNEDNEVYFLSWAWDLSGKEINYYPGEGVEPDSVRIPITVGKVREFIGDGVLLFPKRIITAGIACRIQIWESDQDTREAGHTIRSISETIKNSELNKVLDLVSLASGVSGVTINLVKNAAIELADVIGKILEANSNDYVDLYEGYYSADKEWVNEVEVYKGNSSSISLAKL